MNRTLRGEVLTAITTQNLKKFQDCFSKNKKVSPDSSLTENGDTPLHIMLEREWQEGIDWFLKRFPDYDLHYRNEKNEPPRLVIACNTASA